MQNSDIQYLAIKAIDVDGTLIPIWEFDYENYDAGDYYVIRFTHPDPNISRYNEDEVLDCMYDLLNKVAFRYTPLVSMCTAEHSIGDAVLHNIRHRVVKQKKIVDIALGSLDNEEVLIGHSVKQRMGRHLGVVKLTDGTIMTPDTIDGGSYYTLRRHRYRYVFDDGSTCEYDHELYKME